MMLHRRFLHDDSRGVGEVQNETVRVLDECTGLTGLDIIGVQTVINFACPRDLTSYVHRVGRTARAGREGYAVTFVTDNDRSVLKSIQGGGKGKEKSGKSLVDMAYRQAKAVKALKKAQATGKSVRNVGKSSKNSSSQRNKSRPEEMRELFQNDMSERKQKKGTLQGRKKSKHSFKSKSRYKRR